MRNFCSYVAELEHQNVLELSLEQQQRLDGHLDSELADQSKCFDIDVTESQGQLSLGMRVISALCRSLTHRCSQGTALLRRAMR